MVFLTLEELIAVTRLGQQASIMSQEPIKSAWMLNTSKNSSQSGSRTLQ